MRLIDNRVIEPVLDRYERLEADFETLQAPVDLSPTGAARPTERTTTMTPDEQADFDRGFNEASERELMLQNGIFPHACAEPGCPAIVQYDDEPRCFRHSPASGSSVTGYSARKEASCTSQ